MAPSLRAQAAPPVSAEVTHAWDQITTSRGAVSVHDLCRETGWSNKHLLARFREQIGVTPKRAARMVRFESTLRRVAGATSVAGSRPDWARLAIECGYADQAHLIREFGEFTGTTPGASGAPSGSRPHSSRRASTRVTRSRPAGRRRASGSPGTR